jgi:hypothetical protein
MVDADKDEIRDDTRRSFTLDGKEYFINTPSAETIRQADWQYAKIYNEAMSNGILTQSEMEKILKVRGLIGEEYEAEVSKIRSDLQDKVIELELSRSSQAEDDLVEDLAISVSRLRKRLFELNQQLSGPVSNTCESIAEDSRVDFLVSNMVEDEKGNKIWTENKTKGIISYDLFIADSNRELVRQSKMEVMLWMQGLDSDFLSNTPETQALRALQEKRQKQLVDAIDSLTQKADEVSKGDSEGVPDISLEEGSTKKATKSAKSNKKKGRSKKSEPANDKELTVVEKAV